MDLHRTQLKDVILPKIKSVFVIDYYKGMRSLLESRKDFPYNDIFANPRVRTKTEVIWSSDAFLKQPRLLSDLKGEEKQYYSYLLYKEIKALRTLIETLKTESGGTPLSELLSKSISNIDEKSVYCGNDKIVIVNWGLIPRQPGLEGMGIYRSGRFINDWEEAHNSDPRHYRTPSDSEKVPDQTEKPEPDKSTESTQGKVTETVTEVEQTPDADASHAVKNEETVSHESPTQEAKDITVKENSEDKTEIVNESKKGSTEVTEKNQTQKEDVENGKQTESVSHVRNSSAYGWAELFRGLWKGLCFLFKKLCRILIPLLIILLIILMCLFGFRNCQGPFSQFNPFYNPLPDEPVIMPVGSDCVEMSEDGLYKVANDRLNILLEKENDNTMLDWAKAFKKVYPSSDYEIKYYNEDTYLLQIKVPSEQRLRVKNELNSLLPEFKFDVFEETVFQANFVSDDPALNDERASWYLDAIGAKEAWDLTLGSEDVIVAVVDNGFDLSHPEFTGKVVNAYNVLTRNNKLRPIVTDRGVNAHGTHVAATAVGNCNNASGLLGIAPKCGLMPVQVGNDNPDGTMSNLAVLEGVRYAIKNGADVINVSLGMYTPSEVTEMSEGEQLNYIATSFPHEESMWEKVFEEAGENNCVIVFAAGNDNVISGIDPKKRNTNTIRVSAVSPDIAKASFSNFGRYPELNRDYSTVSAPGVSIYSAAPDGKYMYMRGTSMAAPIVSGAVALLKSSNKNLSAGEAISILQKTGNLVDPSIGPLINISNALKSTMGGNAPKADCEKIREEVQRLRMRLDSLSRLCPDATEPVDTLKYDDVIDDPRSLDGTWKSTTELVNVSDNTPIELYMTFSNLSGRLIIVTNDGKFSAPLTATIADKKIYITQSDNATSDDSDSFYIPYDYTFTSDRKGNLRCHAKSDSNSFSFNLVRIK